MGTLPDLTGALAAARVNATAASDPLARYRCAAWPQRALIEALHRTPPPEVLWHAGNSGSKTTGGLAVTIALLQGRSTLLDWDYSVVTLPVIAPPVTWLLGVESFKLAAESTLPKLRELLGDWPHHETREGGPDAVTKLQIRHRLSRDDERRSDWSRLAVFSYEGPDPEAIRLDGWQCDEPAPMSFIDALRNRGKLGRPLYGFHTLTPIKRSEWEPIFGDFPDEHRVIQRNRLRLQSSVYENRALHLPGCDGNCAGKRTCPDISRAEDAVRTSPFRLARLYGDPVDIAGTCPFDGDELIALRQQAKPGERYGVQWVHKDGRDVLWPVRHDKGMIESWGWPKAGDRCVLVADPSSGVREPDKPDHLQPRNPAGLALGSVAEQRVLARFNGYVPAHELGQMARAVVNRCPDWLMVHETNGGWGDAFLRGFRDSPAVTRGELWFERDPITGKPDAEPGWRQSTTGLGKLMSALQRAIEQRGLKIHSRAAIDNLMKTRLDSNERWDRGSGRGPHGEDVITLGILAYVMERTSLPTRPQHHRTLPQDLQRAVTGNGDWPPSAVPERW